MENKPAERIEYLSPDRIKDKFRNPYFEGPGEFLTATIAKLLREEPHWKKVFGENIDGYKRMDYSIRALPAMRVYSNGDQKDYESWFIEGDVKIDMILPASVRRNELQQIQDTISSAIIQQFRRPEFFDAVEASVPGLNELGKRVTTDKSLGFEFNENIVPLTQITLNFKLDLREWDNYLEKTLRTKDSPFEQVLGDLDRLVTVIEGMREEMDELVVDVEVGADQKV